MSGFEWKHLVKQFFGKIPKPRLWNIKIIMWIFCEFVKFVLIHKELVGFVAFCHCGISGQFCFRFFWVRWVRWKTIWPKLFLIQSLRYHFPFSAFSREKSSFYYYSSNDWYIFLNIIKIILKVLFGWMGQLIPNFSKKVFLITTVTKCT